MKRIASILACFALGAGLCGAPTALAQSSSWNGTWVGHWAQGDGVQIVFAGDEAISVYWRGDYLEETHGAISSGGAVATIAWPSGKAVLTREGTAKAHVVIHETGRADVSFALKKDE